MGYLPGFDHDIFISYAHVDNDPLTEGQKGWIDSFHKTLETRLTGLLGTEPKVWRDPALKGNDYFDQVLPAELQRTAILVSIVTPRYTNSEWCLKELQIFCQAAEATGGVQVGNQARIFKVVKLPVPIERHPQALQGLLGYDFYDRDPRSNAPREFGFEFGDAAKLNFVQKVNDLAYQIEQLLEAFRTTSAEVVKKVVPRTGPTIYLATTSDDLKQVRDAIRRELEQRGNRVVPDRELPATGPELDRLVREQLKDAVLSIHLMGTEYQEAVQRQNDLAAERGAAFGRIIWMPRETPVTDEKQRGYLETLSHDPGSAAFLQTPVEELKTVIQDKLQGAGAKPEPAARTEGPPMVYLIREAQDADAARAVEDFLFDSGCELLLPAEEGDPATIRKDHEEKLRTCDAALIYSGQAADAWLNVQLTELRKAPGYGRERPMAAKGVFLAPPDKPWKQRYRTHDATVIRQAADFDPELLKPFVGQVKGGGAGK
jgi:hypothetical protein